MARQANSYAANRGRAETNAKSKANLLKAINKLKITMKNAGYTREYSNLFNAVKAFSRMPKNSPQANLRARANNVVGRYFLLPGEGGLGVATKTVLAKNLKELAAIYSNKHAKAIYNAAINAGTRDFGRAQPLAAGFARVLPGIVHPLRRFRRA